MRSRQPLEQRDQALSPLERARCLWHEQVVADGDPLRRLHRPLDGARAHPPAGPAAGASMRVAMRSAAGAVGAVGAVVVAEGIACDWRMEGSGTLARTRSRPTGAPGRAGRRGCRAARPDGATPLVGASAAPRADPAGPARGGVSSTAAGGSSRGRRRSRSSPRRVATARGSCAPTSRCGRRRRAARCWRGPRSSRCTRRSSPPGRCGRRSGSGPGLASVHRPPPPRRARPAHDRGRSRDDSRATGTPASDSSTPDGPPPRPGLAARPPCCQEMA